MDGRDDDCDDWAEEVKQRQDFVADESHTSFGIYEDEHDAQVTFRRAPDMGATAFVASAARFDSIDDELFLGQTSTKQSPMMVMATEKAPLFTSDPTPKVAAVETLGSPDLEPSGPVPEAADVKYNEVNPMFESVVNEDEIFRALKAALRPHVEDFQCFPDWTIEAFALIAAEEVYFNVQLHRVPAKGVIRVDFNLRVGNELQFMDIVDRIRGGCRELDRELAALPDLSFDIFSSWSSQDELFPGSMTVDQEDLLLLLEDITSVNSHPFTRFEASKQLKDYCRHLGNRETLRRSQDQFVAAIEKMLHDEDEDVIRYAIFIILTFAQDEASWSGFDLPTLPTYLQTIEQNVHKRSTKKLASDLQSAIVQASSIAVGGKH